MYNKVPFLIKYFCLIEESIITHLPKCHIFYRFLPIMSRKIAHLAIFLIFLALYGCADKYQSYRSNYPFKSPNGQPDYTNLDYWAAHPDKKDPSDSIPAPLRSETRDTLADVFFLHPTTFTDKKEADRPNAAIDDDYINAKTDYSTILFQASAFNQQSRVFSPRYRQAHIGNFYGADSALAVQALQLAYVDVRNAFRHYLQHYNNGRPIIIASHSQGALMAIELLKEFFDNKPLQQQLVVAYVVGWPLETKSFNSLTACVQPAQTNCVCSWRTFKMGYEAPWVKKEKERAAPIIVTNPLSWTTDSGFVSRKANKGAVLTRFNKVFTGAADAQIHHGVLYSYRPHFPGSFLYRTDNYHIGDINLYYLNIRENVRTRLAAFLNKRTSNNQSVR
jgi:hypothetical protein